MKHFIYAEKDINLSPHLRDVYIESYVTDKNAPFVIVCPGGAYRFVSDFNEGKPFAECLNKRGYNAFVLFYSVGMGRAINPNPLKDLAKAIEYIKQGKADFQPKSDRFALMGSSAGGHLCSYFCEKYSDFQNNISLRPDALLLTYPVITMGEYTHRVSRQNFLGFFPEKEKIKDASVELNVTKGFPPTFLWHNKDDQSVPCINSEMLKKALDENSVENELLLYKTGGHGVGLAQGKEAEGWIDKAIDFLDKYLL